jgi:hypothetical protein
MPAYVPQPFLTQAELPADLQPLDWTYRAEMKLIGVKIGAETMRPGERVPVTAYWQALRPMHTNYSVFVHLIGRAYTNVGQFNTYPGLGLRPTRSLEPGQIVADTYPVLVAGGSAAPTRLLVNIGLFDFTEAGRPGLTALASNGQPVAPTVGQLKLIPATWPAAPAPLAEFADHIALGEFAINDCQSRTGGCHIVFTWIGQAKPSADYTVFIQLWQNGRQVTGFDALPLGGDYPTSLWEAGEVIIDPHPLNLAAVAPGEYDLLAGLYHLASGTRLSASSQGTPLPNSALNLGHLHLK